MTEGRRAGVVHHQLHHTHRNLPHHLCEFDGAREWQLTIANTLQESVTQFRAQGEINTPIKSIRPERSKGFDAVESSDPSLHSGRTGFRIFCVAALKALRLRAARGWKHQCSLSV